MSRFETASIRPPTPYPYTIKPKRTGGLTRNLSFIGARAKGDRLSWPTPADSINTWLKKFTQANGLPPISAHSFRHMSATYLIASGTDIRTVSGKLGHSQTSTTMNIYAHLLKSAEAETASTMENILQQATDKAKQAQKKQAK
jgi:integrase